MLSLQYLSKADKKKYENSPRSNKYINVMLKGQQCGNDADTPSVVVSPGNLQLQLIHHVSSNESSRYVRIFMSRN